MSCNKRAPGVQTDDRRGLNCSRGTGHDGPCQTSVSVDGRRTRLEWW